MCSSQTPPLAAPAHTGKPHTSVVVATCSAAGLDRLLQTGNADFIVAEMGIFSLVGFSTWVATLAVLLSTLHWINDRHRQVQVSFDSTS